MFVIGITVAVPGILVSPYFLSQDLFDFYKHNGRCFFIIPKTRQTTAMIYLCEIMISLHNPLSALMMLYSMKSQINEIINRHWKRFKKVPIYNNKINNVSVVNIRENRRK